MRSQAEAATIAATCCRCCLTAVAAAACLLLRLLLNKWSGASCWEMPDAHAVRLRLQHAMAGLCVCVCMWGTGRAPSRQEART